MTSGPEDRELVERLVAGDSRAFSTLVGRHEDMVFSVCLRILGDREAALDATQETFLALFRRAGTFRGEAKLTTWLYRVAVNASLDATRSRRRHLTTPLPADTDPADPRGEDAYAAADLRPAIEAALQDIPAEFRAAVVLTDALGLGYAEVAEILGVPPGTVKSRVFRARRLLAERLGNLAGSGEHPMDANIDPFEADDSEADHAGTEYA